MKQAQTAALLHNIVQDYAVIAFWGQTNNDARHGPPQVNQRENDIPQTWVHLTAAITLTTAV